MMTFFAVIGIVAIAMLAFLFIQYNSEIGDIGQGDGFICKVFGFGYVYANDNTILKDNCNRLRKTQGKNLFINAPAWFNRYVCNIGGVKK